MRFCAFTHAGAARLGLVDDGEVFALPEGVTLRGLLEAGDDSLQSAGQSARWAGELVLPIDGLVLRSPLPDPPTVRDFYAFERHVATARRSRGLEMDPLWYEQPVFYFSNPYAICGPGDLVAAPAGSVELDFELEVAAIIGRRGRDLVPSEAGAYLAGFCIMNDWSARDIQRREMPLQMGPVKGKDFATSLGPFFVTADELADVHSREGFDLTMTARVNGREYSRANLAELYWSFEEMVAYASRSTEVRPGDVLGSGTCGTGCILELSAVHGPDAYPWLQPGDLVELEVDRLGLLANTVAEPGTPPTPSD